MKSNLLALNKVEGLKLNDEQKEAVLYNKGPLLIVAGAGTGKTTVITQRIVNLIEKGLAKPEEILAVTFTEKAASEMEERVDRALDYGYVDLWISTFHAFCERVLRDYALDIGLPPDFKILDETAGWLLARQNLEKFDLKYYKTLGNPTKFIQVLISHFSHCKDQEVYPEDYLNYADNLKTTDDGPDDSEAERVKEIANAYHVYQRILLENSSLDFGDLINYCLKLFKKRPLILKKYRQRFKYILVDEFQDTNWAQYELIKMLAEPENNLTVCADDDQAIYRWRGASFSNIVKFQEDFSKAKQVSLIKNYRSAQNILDKSYEFIKQNDPDRLEFRNKISKKLLASTKEEGVIKHLHCKSLDQEVGQVLKNILEILKKDASAGSAQATSYNDFAILVRANDHAIPFIQALERANLPYQFLASRGLYSKPIILDIISYFKLLDNYHEGIAVYRILNLPFLEINDKDVANITQYSYKKTKSLFETLNELSLINGISADTKEKVAHLLSIIAKHSVMAREKRASEIFVSFLGDSGYLKYLVNNGQQDKIDLINQFYKKIKKFEESNLESSLRSFMGQMMLELEAGSEGKLEFDPNKGPDMIKVMTIHGAKGLEFKYVFLVNMVDKRFPTIERKDPIELPDELIKDIKPKGDIHLQEERRLCYVAMTRAKKELYFVSGEDYGGQRKKKISRFLTEMGYKQEDALPEKDRSGFMGNKEFPTILRKKEDFVYEIPDHFSFSQLHTYEKCPLQYKFEYILKIPKKGKAVFSFGSTIHNTLHQFLKFANGGDDSQENLFGESKSKKDKKIDFKFLKDLYKKNWIDEWYIDKKQKSDYLKQGEKIIKEFYEEFEKKSPALLVIDGQPALEVPFNLKVGNDVIYGRIDRIDGKKGAIEIIDYKTGKAKEKLSPEDKEQLLIYQIASQEILNEKPVKLTYHYLEENKKVSFLGSDAEIENLKIKIKEIIKKIKNNEFKPNPGHDCQYCDYRDLCDV